MPLTAIDVFAGAGGLTVGLKRAGFQVTSAVELEPRAWSTYQANHGEVKCLMQDVASVSGADLAAAANGLRADLLACCPPCQGFTSLTSKYRVKQDPRNQLVLEMARLAEESRPRAVMMENVPGLTRKGRSLHCQLRTRLERLGYRLTEGILQVADYGVPQLRRRFVLLAGLGFEIPLPSATHSGSAESGRQQWRTVREAIEHMHEPLTLAEAKARGPVRCSDWHIVRNLSQRNIQRIKAAKPGTTWKRIPEHLRPACHRDGYIGFTNVYGRMEWDRPSPTITGGCTTFSKGRFGHPTADRTISVREAALLQTFPPNYVFDAPFIDPVCNMIGNALPCDFAEVIARQCATRLRQQLATERTCIAAPASSHSQPPREPTPTCA